MVVDPVAPALSINREEVLSEIRAARDGLDPEGSVFVGINNKGLHSDGTRVEGEPLLRTFNEEEWRRELMIYHKADLNVKGIEPFKGEVTQAVTIPELDEEPLQVRYYGLEPKEDGIWGHGPGVLDPRAHIVPGVLTETDIVWPFVYVYAEIKAMLGMSAEQTGDRHANSMLSTSADEAARVLGLGLLRDLGGRKARYMETADAVDVCDDPKEEREPTPAALRAPPSPDQRRRKVPIADVIDSDTVEPTWGAPSAACAFDVQASHWDTGSPDPSKPSKPMTDKRTASALQIDAKQAASLGNHKEAFQLMEKAIALVCGGEARDMPTAHEMDFDPMREEAPVPPSGQSMVPRSFKPATPYELADGTTHMVGAGLYTEDEWFAKTLEAQDMVDASRRAVARTKHIESMSKYDGPPLERSESQLDSIASVESLGSQIKHKAERARNVMEVSRSKEASPTQTPAPAPELPGTSQLASLGESLGDMTIDIKAEQQAKWDAAADKLKEQAASIWGQGASSGDM